MNKETMNIVQSLPSFYFTISNRSMACPTWASFCTAKSTVFITRATTRLPSAGPACMWLRPPYTTQRGWCPSSSPGCTPWSPWPGSLIAQWGPGWDTTGFRYVVQPRCKNYQGHERHKSCIGADFQFHSGREPGTTFITCTTNTSTATMGPSTYPWISYLALMLLVRNVSICHFFYFLKRQMRK